MWLNQGVLRQLEKMEDLKGDFLNDAQVYHAGKIAYAADWET